MYLHYTYVPFNRFSLKSKIGKFRNLSDLSSYRSSENYCTADVILNIDFREHLFLNNFKNI